MAALTKEPLRGSLILVLLSFVVWLLSPMLMDIFPGWITARWLVIHTGIGIGMWIANWYVEHRWGKNRPVIIGWYLLIWLVVLPILVMLQ